VLGALLGTRFFASSLLRQNNVLLAVPAIFIYIIKH
jgi:hypothetical protein